MPFTENDISSSQPVLLDKATTPEQESSPQFLTDTERFLLDFRSAAQSYSHNQDLDFRKIAPHINDPWLYTMMQSNLEKIRTYGIDSALLYWAANHSVSTFFDTVDYLTTTIKIDTNLYLSRSSFSSEENALQFLQMLYDNLDKVTIEKKYKSKYLILHNSAAVQTLPRKKINLSLYEITKLINELGYYFYQEKDNPEIENLYLGWKDVINDTNSNYQILPNFFLDFIDKHSQDSKKDTLFYREVSNTPDEIEHSELLLETLEKNIFTHTLSLNDLQLPLHDFFESNLYLELQSLGNTILALSNVDLSAEQSQRLFNCIQTLVSDIFNIQNRNIETENVILESVMHSLSFLPNSYFASNEMHDFIKSVYYKKDTTNSFALSPNNLLANKNTDIVVSYANTLLKNLQTETDSNYINFCLLHLGNIIDEIFTNDPQQASSLAKKLLETIIFFEKNTSIQLLTQGNANIRAISCYSDLKANNGSLEIINTSLESKIENVIKPYSEQLLFTYDLVPIFLKLEKTYPLTVVTELLNEFTSTVNEIYTIINSKNHTENINHNVFLHDLNMISENIISFLISFKGNKNAKAWILETVKQHSFAVFSHKMNSLSSILNIEVSDLFYNSMPQDIVVSAHQGQIYTLLLYNWAFSKDDPAKFYKIVNSGQPIKEIVSNLSSEYIVDFFLTQNINLTPEQLNTIVTTWDMAYIPKLLEALHNFDITDTMKEFATYLTLILKLTIDNQFEQSINPDVPLTELNNLNLEEKRLLSFIRRHNAQTKKEFESRGVDIEMFKKGAERELKGSVRAENIITSNVEMIDKSIKNFLHEINEYRDEFPTISRLANEIAAETNSAVNSNSIAELIRWHERNRATTITNVPLQEMLATRTDSIEKTTDVFDWVNLHKPEWFKKDTTTANSPKDKHKKLLRKTLGFDNTGAAVKVKDREKFIIQIYELAKLDNTMTPLIEALYFSATSNKNSEKPNIAFIFSNLKQKVLELESELKTITNNDQVKNTLHYPKLSSLIEIMLEIIMRISSATSNIEKARDQKYHVKINRWNRNPAKDIFLGNILMCCVAIESQVSGFAMLQYLGGLDTEINTITDMTTGEIVGGSFEFLALKDDNQIAYAIDNIELNPSHTYIDTLVRETLSDMAAETSQAMLQNMHLTTDIILGDMHNDVPVADLLKGRIKLKKIGGNNLGLSHYLDIFQSSPELFNIRRNPTAFHTVRYNTLRAAESKQEITRTEINPNVETSVLHDYEMPDFWNQHKEQIKELEAEIFGYIGYNENDLESLFTSPENIVVIARDSNNNIVGYSAGYPSDTETFYVSSTAILPTFRGKQLVRSLLSDLENTAKDRNYIYLERHAMLDTGYAISLLKNAHTAGTLVEPDVVTDNNGVLLVKRTLERIQKINYKGGRTQLYIKTKIA